MSVLKVQKLYQLCLENIVSNSNFWLNVKAFQEKNDGNNSSPFDSLPVALEQDLINSFQVIYDPAWHLENDQITLRMFITRRISKLIITENMDKETLSHIRATCRNLKHLEMKNIGEAFPYLKAIGPALTNVIFLHFEPMVYVNSSSIKYIRSHCPNLRKLRLNLCFINDKAISYLKSIPSLVEIDLRNTDITASGVNRILRHNPQLTHLNHPDVFRALIKNHSWFLSRISSSQYSLVDMYCQLTRRDDGESLLTKLVSSCPHLERIQIEMDPRTSPQGLSQLNRLTRLNELDIQCLPVTGTSPVPESSSLFSQGILSVVSVRGSQLSSLFLEGVLHVNMHQLQLHCPNLNSLGIFYNSYAPTSFHVPDDLTITKPFPALTRLMFGSNAGDDDFDPRYLSWLLSNPQLNELSLSGSPLLTGSLFAVAFANSGGFPHLRRLELDYCNISSELITEFLSQCGRKSLRELLICGPFMREQASPAHSYIVCEKLDVRLEACYYSFVKMKKRMVRSTQLYELKI